MRPKPRQRISNQYNSPVTELILLTDHIRDDLHERLLRLLHQFRKLRRQLFFRPVFQLRPYLLLHLPRRQRDAMPRSLLIRHQLLKLQRVLREVDIPDPIDKALLRLQRTVNAGDEIREDLNPLVMEEREAFLKHPASRVGRQVLRHRAPQRDVAGEGALHGWFEDLADGGRGAVGADEEISAHIARRPVLRRELDLNSIAQVLEAGDLVAVQVLRGAIVRLGSGNVAVVALNLIIVCSQDVVHEVPAGHMLGPVVAVDDAPFFVQVHACAGADGDGALAAVILLEEGEQVAACDDAGALVVEKGRRVALEDGGVVSDLLEGYTAEKAA